MNILLVGENNFLSQLESTIRSIFRGQIKVNLVEARKAVAAVTDEHPDIIIIDLKAADGSLKLLLRAFKALDEDIQVLVLTDSRYNHLTKSMEHGADSFIVKPFEETELKARIKSAQKVREKIKALREKEKALQESTENYRALVDFTPDWDYLIDVAGKFFYVSSSCEQITGYPPGEFEDLDKLLEITHPDDRAALCNHVKDSLRSSEPLSFEFRIIHRNGEERWICHVCQPFYSSDQKLMGRRSSNRDITRQKQLEEALKKSKEKYRFETELVEGILNGISDIVGLQMPDHTIIRYNQVGYQFLGKTLEEVKGKKCYELIGLSQECELCATRQALKSKKIESIEKYIPELDMYLECRSNPIVDSSGKVNLVVEQLRDITKNKKMEDALRKSESAYRRITDSMQDLISQTDEKGIFQYVSPSHKNVLGYNQEDLLGQSAFKFVHPDNAAGLLASFQESLDKKTPARAEYRYRHAKGNYLWVETLGKVLQDDKGKVTGAIFSSRDISKRKRAEEALQRAHDELEKKVLERTAELVQANKELQAEIDERIMAEKALQESERRYRTLMENIPIGIYRSTPEPEGRFLVANPAFYKIFGLDSKDDLQKLRVVDLYIEPEDRKAFSDTLMRDGNVTGVDLKLKKMDGTPLWGLVTASVVHDEDGKAVYFDSTIEDITQRKQAEEEILARNEELTALYTLSTHMRATKSTDELLPILLIEARRLLRSDHGIITLLSADRKHFTVVCGDGHWKYSVGRFAEAEQGPCGMVLRTGNPYVSKNYSAEALPLDNAGEIGPALFVPLKSEKRLLGVMAVARHMGEKIRPFTPSEINLLATIGEITGNTLRRHLLYENAQKRLRHLQALRNIDMAITGSLDLRVTFKVVLDEITSQLNVDAAAILRLSPYTGILKYEAWRGFHTDHTKHVEMRLGEGYAGQAALERRFISIPDLRKVEHDPFQGQLIAEEDFSAYYAVPLIAKGCVQGVLEVFHRKSFNSHEEWVTFFETLAGQAAIAIDNAELFYNLESTNVELVQAYDTTIEGWAYALDMRDKETEGHSRRVTEITLNIADKMGIKGEDLAHVRRGALLHDIGKMGIPDSILLKPDKLTEEEWELMHKHPEYAFEMLSPITYLRPALDIPYCHHEKWDGTGYPRGIKGEAIPLAARIFAVADVFDALTSDRPYRPAWTREQALEYIREQSGRHFDPQVVEVFLNELKK